MSLGRPVRIGVVDSGINPRHRQVGGISGGLGVRVRDGNVETDGAWEDLIGHGTAVAATIRGHVPNAELHAIRVFRRRLVARVEALVYAVDWAAAHELDLLNMSLGWESPEKQADVVAACVRARGSGVQILTAAPDGGTSSLVPGATLVSADAELSGSELRIENGILYASPWARSLGELPKERNVRGASLAVANATGIVAERVEQGSITLSTASLAELLETTK